MAVCVCRCVCKEGGAPHLEDGVRVVGADDGHHVQFLARLRPQPLHGVHCAAVRLAPWSELGQSAHRWDHCGERRISAVQLRGTGDTDDCLRARSTRGEHFPDHHAFCQIIYPVTTNIVQDDYTFFIYEP